MIEVHWSSFFVCFIDKVHKHEILVDTEAVLVELWDTCMVKFAGALGRLYWMNWNLDFENWLEKYLNWQNFWFRKKWKVKFEFVNFWSWQQKSLRFCRDLTLVSFDDDQQSKWVLEMSQWILFTVFNSISTSIFHQFAIKIPRKSSICQEFSCWC